MTRREIIDEYHRAVTSYERAISLRGFGPVSDDLLRKATIRQRRAYAAYKALRSQP